MKECTLDFLCPVEPFYKILLALVVYTSPTKLLASKLPLRQTLVEQLTPTTSVYLTVVLRAILITSALSCSFAMQTLCEVVSPLNHSYLERVKSLPSRGNKTLHGSFSVLPPYLEEFDCSTKYCAGRKPGYLLGA